MLHDNTKQAKMIERTKWGFKNGGDMTVNGGNTAAEAKIKVLDSVVCLCVCFLWLKKMGYLLDW